MPIRFRFRLIPFIATVLVVTLGVSLAHWQERRAAGKIALQQQLAERAHAAPLALGAAPLAAPDMAYRPVQATGEFLRDWPLYLDNRPQDWRVGFYLLMPLRIAGTSTVVLVARGWLPRNNAEHDKLPPFSTPAGVVTVHGMAVAGMGHVMQLGTATPVKPGAILQNLEVADFGAASALAVQPFFIEQTDPAGPGELLVRAWPAPDLGVERHQGYAFQWYALSVMALLFFVITGCRREPKQTE